MQLTSDKQSPNSFPQVHLFFFFFKPKQEDALISNKFCSVNVF